MIQMNETWDYKLAGMFRDRDNPTNTPIGACLGKVLSTNPARIQIQDSNFIIDGEQLYVSYHLMERYSKYSELVGSMSGNINIDCHPCDGSYSGNIISNGVVKLEEVWKVGDLVLVVPSSNEQQFFVVDVVRKLFGNNGQMA